MYEARGFNVVRVEGDREFACLENELLPTPLNIADADNHVAKIEQSIQTIKERTRCMVQGLPFKRIPKAMIRAIVEHANQLLNMFPARNGVLLSTLSPLTIMTGRQTPNYDDMKIEFGSYAQVFEDNQGTNTVRARTTGAIALGPTGNAQGGFYFLSLVTGRKLSRQQWDALPMPDEVIAEVERMAEDEDQPIIGPGAPLFEWRPGVEIEGDILADFLPQDDGHGDVEQFYQPDNDEDDETVFGQDPDKEDTQDSASNAEETDPALDDYEGEEQRSENGSVSDSAEESRSKQDSSFDEEQHDDPYNQEASSSEDSSHETVDVETVDDDTPEDELTAPDTRTRVQIRHNLRPNRARNYGHRVDHSMDTTRNSKTYDTQLLQQEEPENGPTDTL
jgi:hypothetical protein